MRRSRRYLSEGEELPKARPVPPKLPPGSVRIGGGAWSTVAAFWLRGERLDPDVITRAMGIEPNRADRRGEPRTSNPQHKRADGRLDVGVRERALPRRRSPRLGATLRLDIYEPDDAQPE
jgi:hypothetical protein